MPKRHAYDPIDRPDVEVLVDGEWRYGQVRMWTLRDDGQVVGQLSWSAPDGNRIDDFPLEQLRPVDEYTGQPLDPATVWPWNRPTSTPSSTGSSDPA